ncbi:FxsA family protein [Pelagibius sp. CAU 1746]|uniref:FxsA family protein n=1 Tax=Pelagibius sp. CAU 1746 TaxID=3140370 RepID=UPI00325B4393
MALILLALFIGLPLLEVAVFIQVGEAIGVWPTIAATVATALAGSLLLRTQGLAALTRARAQMDQGQLPAREMFEGVCLVLAGALLLVPGFVTDAIGLLLFVPPARELLRLMIARHIAAKAARGEARVFVDGVEVRPDGPGRDDSRGGGPRQGPRQGPGRGPVIDGDYEDLSSDGGKDGEDGRNASDLRRLGR